MATATITLEGPVVLLPLEEYESLMERLESLEDLLDEELLTSSCTSSRASRGQSRL